MDLVVHIPFRTDEDYVRALIFARQAPSFTVEESDGKKFAIAIFPSLPTGIDVAIELIGEALQLSNAWASINSKRMSGLVKLWQRLSCYRESLEVEDHSRYCLDKSAHFNYLVGCKEYQCPVPCQFICTPCMRLEQAGLPVVTAERSRIAAELAEVDWCPQLQFPEDDENAIIRPIAVKPHSAPAS